MAREMQLKKGSAIKFVMDEDEELYIINCPNGDEDAFPVLQSNEYFSVNTKVLFDNLNYDYRNLKYIFDMVRVKDEEEEMYHLILRDNEPRRAKQEDNDNLSDNDDIDPNP